MNLKYDEYIIDPDVKVFRQNEVWNIDTQYNDEYVKVRYESEPKVDPLTQLRCDLILKYCEKSKYDFEDKILDYGCGTGKVTEELIRRNIIAHGYDISPYHTSFQKLTEEEIEKSAWNCVTFFDSLEHTKHPRDVVKALNPNYVVISIPECHFPENEEWFMNWKHRRPGEHIWHFNRESLDYFFLTLGYKRIIHSNFEDKIRTPYDPFLSNILTGVYKAI